MAPTTPNLITAWLIICSYFVPLSNASAQNQLLLLPGILYFDYEETAEDGSFLDAETDPISGLSAEYKFQHASGIRGVIHGGMYTGNVEYDGHAYPTGQPVTTYTKTNIFNLGAIASFPLQDSASTVYFNIGYEFRRWERDIQPTVDPVIGQVSGLYEVYEWSEFSMGLELNLNDALKNQWTFYAGAFRTINPRIEIDLSANGNGKPRLYMGSDLGVELSAQWLAARKSRSQAGAKLSYKHWRFGQSNSEVLPDNSVVTEPRSRTHIIQLEYILAIDI